MQVCVKYGWKGVVSLGCLSQSCPTLGFEADFLWYLELPDLARLAGQSDIISASPA